MSVDIKIGLVRPATRPATWGDVVTEVLYMFLAVVFAYPLIPTLVDRLALDAETGYVLSGAFVVFALLHLYDAVRITRGLRKSKTGA